MVANDVDEYLAALPEPKRSTLGELRAIIRSFLPDAVEKMSYRMPAFAVDGKVLAGYAAFTNHLAYLPHSSLVIDRVPGTERYTSTPGSLHFPVDECLPRDLVEQLIEAKRQVIAER